VFLNVGLISFSKENAYFAFQDNIHVVSDVILAENGLLGSEFHESCLFIDANSLVGILALDEA
jgi:hypothetical protein